MSSASSPPAKTPAHLEVAREGAAVLLRVIGLGNMNISLTMKDFVSASLTAEYQHFAIDLQQCRGMDSTFMGTIVGISREIREHQGWLCMLNVSSENQNLLDLIGAGPFLDCREDFPLVSVETERLEGDADPTRRLEHIRKAHEHLVAIDERNRERFGRFLQELGEEMAAAAAAQPVAQDKPVDAFRDLAQVNEGSGEADESPPPPHAAQNEDTPSAHPDPPA